MTSLCTLKAKRLCKSHHELCHCLLSVMHCHGLHHITMTAVVGKWEQGYQQCRCIQYPGCQPWVIPTKTHGWGGHMYIALQKLKEHLNSIISAVLGLEGGGDKNLNPY